VEHQRIKREAVPALNAKAFLSEIGAGMTVAQYQKRQSIFSQGDASDAIFYIHKGTAKLTVVSPHGKEAIIAILGPNDFLGEDCLADQPSRKASATCMSDCLIARLLKKDVIAALHAQQIFAEAFLHYLLSRNLRLEEDLVDHLFNSSEKRLARVLLLMANLGKEGESEPIIPKISQETLAELVGTTRSRVSFFMNRFRKLGLVDYNGGQKRGGLQVRSSLLNVVLHDGERQTRGLEIP